MTEPHPVFIPGLELNERFYREIVKPILFQAFPELVYAAALIGPGSDVLGFDTARSTDHDWGPRLQIFVGPNQSDLIPRIDTHLRVNLPAEFLGFSTGFSRPDAGGVRLREWALEGEVNHKIEVTTIESWFRDVLGRDPRAGKCAHDWLLAPQQILRSLTAGRIYHDGTGELQAIQKALTWYPDEIWRYLLACQWEKISQQEPFVGRTGEVGDELGSILIAAELVGDLMGLGFLIERVYAPYSKWFGTAFSQLACSQDLAAPLHAALTATSWQAREAHLVVAGERLGQLFNELGLTEWVDPTARRFHDRPFRVIGAERFVAALDAAITSPEVRAIISRTGWIGGIDQFSRSVDLKTAPSAVERLKALFLD